MAEKKVKRIVAHPKLYLAVGGKLQHVKKGTELVITKSQAKTMGGKLLDTSQAKKLDTTKDGGAVSDEAAEVVRLTTALEEAVAETGKANTALTQTATNLEAAKKEIKSLKAKAT